MSVLLVDYNNLVMRSLFNKDVDIKSDNPLMDVWEFLTFENIMDFFQRFNHINEIIIAKDSTNTWRKEVFSRYKEKRKDQKDDEVNWDLVYEYFHSFFNELKDNTPFKCIQVNRCEADDIIGNLASILNKKVIIYSSDQDFKQCLNENVRQYSPYHDDWVKPEENYLIKNILTGQAKDGIFNIITPIDWPDGVRKPGFGEKKMNDWIDIGLNKMLNKPIKYNKPEYKGECLPAERYQLNEVLMDFRKIPEDIQLMIQKTYREYKQAEISNLYPFINGKGWRKYLDSYEQIENLMLKLKLF